MRELTKEEKKEKIRMIHSKLNDYLNDFKTKSSIYYCMRGELRILNDFIFDEPLTKEEMNYIDECLGILTLTYGRQHHSFI